MTTTDQELRSLFTLLDDPDTRVGEAVTDKLRQKGTSVIEPLLEFIDLSPDELARDRAEQIVQEFNDDVLVREFENLRRRFESGQIDILEDGALLIARYGQPMLDTEHCRRELSALSGKLREVVAGILERTDVLRATNDFFFEREKFRGNQTKFLDAENSYLNKVVERRIGIPISLAVVYLLVANRRVGLPFSGASAPGHFLIRYDGLEEPLFIDAFNGGVILRKRDIQRFLEASGLPFNEQFLQPSTDRAILLRMIRNLILVFSETGNQRGERAFKRFMHALAPQQE